MTPYGVERNFRKSPFRYESNGVIYVFSSALHMSKFMNKRKAIQEYVNKSLSNRFDVSCNFPIIGDIIAYLKIESRGFLIIVGDVEIWEKKNILLNGAELTKNL